MSNPTFDSIDLTTDAPREIIGSPADRSFRESMPGVNGSFAQDNGYGARAIQLTGYYESGTNETAALAVTDLKLSIRTIQANIGKVATYMGEDGTEYTPTQFANYTPGPITVRPSGASFIAICPISATIVDLEP